MKTTRHPGDMPGVSWFKNPATGWYMKQMKQRHNFDNLQGRDNDMSNQVIKLIEDMTASVDEFREDHRQEVKALADRLEKIELDAQMIGSNPGTGPLGGAQSEEQRMYHNAFFNALAKGKDALPADLRNSLSTGSGPDGGLWIPAATANKITTRLFETSPMRQVANIMTIDADRIEIPKDTDDATSGGWVGEKQSRPATATPEVGLQEIPLFEQYCMPETTQRILDMQAIVDIESWLIEKIVRKLSHTENTAFISGTGVAQPRGILSYSTEATADESRDWGILEHIPTGASGGWLSAASGASDPLLELVFSLKDQYLQNAVFVMKRTTLASVAKLKDPDGNYLLSVVNGMHKNIRTNFRLLGFPVLLANDMPAIGADSLSVAFGDFSAGYQILDHVKGVSIMRDSLTNRPMVRFYTQKYVGGDITSFDAVKLLKFSTT